MSTRLETTGAVAPSPHSTGSGPRLGIDRGVGLGLGRGVPVLLVALAAPLTAVVTVPWFVTQDGPAHLYNAEILARSFTGDTPFAGWYQVRWEPLPNWAGHVLLMALHTITTPRLANVAVNTLTLVGFAGAVLWLRLVVCGPRGLGAAALLAALLSLNIAWLFGFTSFVLGACLFPLTLAVWWTGRDRLSGGRTVVLSALLTLGYFCHLVSLGLTVLGLGVLALATPITAGAAADRRRRWSERLIRTAGAGLPLIPLGVGYLGLSRRGGGMQPLWGHLTHPLSPRAWAVQLTWADPITIAARTVLPFIDRASGKAILLAPVLWFLAALALAAVATLQARMAEGRGGSGSGSGTAAAGRRGWLVLAVLLIAAGITGPDTLGLNHGHYLPQRVLLLGLVALVPLLDLDFRRRAVRGATVALVVALSLQSALVWDHALVAQRTAGTFWRARPAVGQNQRVATLLLQLKGRSRSNPLLHADCLLGLGTGNILWSNYEARHYYFPVQFRDGLDRPDPGELEAIWVQDAPGDAALRADRWRRLLERHHQAIDVLVVWGTEPRIDSINDRWFRPTAQDGPLHVLRHR